MRESDHVIVSLTVGESFLLVVTVTEEGLLTHGTHKVLKRISYGYSSE